MQSIKSLSRILSTSQTAHETTNQKQANPLPTSTPTPTPTSTSTSTSKQRQIFNFFNKNLTRETQPSNKRIKKYNMQKENDDFSKTLRQKTLDTKDKQDQRHETKKKSLIENYNILSQPKLLSKKGSSLREKVIIKKKKKALIRETEKEPLNFNEQRGLFSIKKLPETPLPYNKQKELYSTKKLPETPK
jgi:hypothetical protein